MATSKYFNVTVKPDMTGQNAVTAFADDDVLFHWTAFDVPKGAAKLIGITTLVKGTDGARQEFAQDVYFAKADSDNSAPSEFGNVNGTANFTMQWFDNAIGCVNIPVTDYRDGLDAMAVSYTGLTATGCGMVLEGTPTSGTNVGYDKLYLCAIAKGAFDFNTGSLLNQGSGQAVTTSSTTLTTDGTHATQVFCVGDVIVAQDNAAIGTVTAVNSTTSITVDAVAAVLADDDELCNKNPITYILHFEK